ncbi:MAG: hypothetical protein FJY06_01100 [Bacteroidetes bacterium]|nr:hypothetical protein [Bacteroidota bacterium]
MKKLFKPKGIDLLNVRDQALRHQVKEWSIKSWGKFNGFEVFTWLNPSREKLIATLDSMPFPIIWVSTDDVFQDQCREEQNTFPNVQHVFIVSTRYSIENHFGETKKLGSFFEVFFIPELMANKGIVVVTAKGKNGEQLIHDFTLSLTHSCE